MEWQQVMRDVGELTQDNYLVRGVLTVGAAALAVLLTAWRVFRRKTEVPRVKIDAPANVEVSVRPTSTDRVK